MIDALMKMISLAIGTALIAASVAIGLHLSDIEALLFGVGLGMVMGAIGITISINKGQ